MGKSNAKRAEAVAFGWYGGKYSHLDWLLPLLPPSQLRVQIENAPAIDVRAEIRGLRSISAVRIRWIDRKYAT